MSPSATSSRRRRLGRRGVTTLEFAVVANVLLLLLVGGIDIGRYFFVNESLKYYIGELARGVVLNPDADWATRKYTLLSRAPILEASKFTALDVNITRAAATRAAPQGSPHLDLVMRDEIACGGRRGLCGEA